MNFENFKTSKPKPIAKRRTDGKPSAFQAQLDVLSQLIPAIFAFSICLLSVAAGYAKSESDLVLWGASYGPRTLHESWRLISAIYLDTHQALMVVNAVATFVLGRAVSRATGPLYFCLIFLFAGAAGVLTGTLLQPQSVVFSSSFGVVALIGSLLASHFFDRRRQPTSLAMVGWSGAYLIFLMLMAIRSRLGVSIAALEVAAAFGFAGPFFLRVSRRHVLAPITGVFVILLSLRFAIGSLPSSVDRFELETSFTALRLQTAHELKMINEKFLNGEISDTQLADLLTRNVLAPSDRLLLQIESIHDGSLDHEWLAKNTAELKFRSMSLETVIAVYAAKTNLLEADDLAHLHSDQVPAKLERFWFGQLPALQTRELQIVRLALEYPAANDNFQRLRVGLAKDMRTLSEGAAHLESQNTEEWITSLKSDVMFREVRLPSSELNAPLHDDYVPPGLSKQLGARVARIQKIETALTPFLSHQDSERQHLTQLKEFLTELDVAAVRDSH